MINVLSSAFNVKLNALHALRFEAGLFNALRQCYKQVVCGQNNNALLRNYGNYRKMMNACMGDYNKH